MSAYDEDFDSETPPAVPSEFTNESFGTVETVTAQYYSSPNSLRVYDGGNTNRYLRLLQNYADQETLSFMIRHESTTDKSGLHLQKTTGVYNFAECGISLLFQNDGTIMYYASTGAWTATGASYVANAWKLMKLVYYTATDTYDLYYDGVQIGTGLAPFYTGKVPSAQIIWKGKGSDLIIVEFWLDDITITTSGWTGTFCGVTDPATINGVDVSNIAMVNGVG